MKGEVLYYFAFDIANELQVEMARRLLEEQGLSAGSDMGPAWPRGLALPAPLAASSSEKLTVLGVQLRVELRLFDFGAISIVMSGPFTLDALQDLRKYLTPALTDGQSLDERARQLCEKTCAAILPALVKPSAVGPPESYTVFYLRDLGTTDEADTWLAGHRTEVAGLLAGLSPGRISAGQVDKVFRQQRSLSKSDAVVMAWDAALAIDSEGPATDVLFAIELANLQLEEFRHMDRLLDRFLDNAYGDLERRSLSLLGPSAVLRKLRRFRVDFAKLADEVTNTTKVFGDWHMARVYQAARERFHLDRWRDSVERRLYDLNQLYDLVRSELWDRRMFLLELVIAVLIVLELVVGLGPIR